MQPPRSALKRANIHCCKRTRPDLALAGITRRGRQSTLKVCYFFFLARPNLVCILYIDPKKQLHVCKSLFRNTGIVKITGLVTTEANPLGYLVRKVWGLCSQSHQPYSKAKMSVLAPFLCTLGGKINLKVAVLPHR